MESINEDIILTYQYKGLQINIFGQDFVNNNKDNCTFIYNDKEYELTHYFNPIPRKFKESRYSYEEEDEQNPICIEIKITLKGVDNITDLSYMFHNCYTLVKIENL